MKDAFLMVTTPDLPGHEIEKCLGVVWGEAVININVFREALSTITEILGARSRPFESRLKAARTIALNEMILQAAKRDANAIVGLHFTHETPRGSMIMVVASGTAVRAKGPSVDTSSDKSAETEQNNGDAS
ncbi:MAG: YbjQ family protein [Bdellovibrionales bacterium]|nr:YbjQ family protein [Bdellovibrionales bacterium]